MVFKKELKIELSGVEIEEIVNKHVSRMMEEEGYKFDYSRNEDSIPFPDMFYRGGEKT